MSNNLPPGWEAKWSAPHNRYYYVNHGTKTTQWERPAAPRAQPKPPTSLPPGWQAKWSSPHGRYYYVNHNTKTTQWEAPKVTFSSQTTTQHSMRQTTGGTAYNISAVSSESAEDEDEENNEANGKFKWNNQAIHKEQTDKLQQIYLSFVDDGNQGFISYLKNNKNITDYKTAVEKSNKEAYYTLFQANINLDYYDYEKAERDLKNFIKNAKRELAEKKRREEQERKEAEERARQMAIREAENEERNRQKAKMQLENLKNLYEGQANRVGGGYLTWDEAVVTIFGGFTKNQTKKFVFYLSTKRASHIISLTPIGTLIIPRTQLIAHLPPHKMITIQHKTPLNNCGKP